MTYQHTDQDGATLQINDYYSVRHGQQVYVKTPADGAYVAPAKASEAAAALLYESGVRPSTTAALDCPEHYEKRALAHLQQAQKLRARKAEQERERNRLNRIIGGIEGVIGEPESGDIPQYVMDRIARWVADTYEKERGETAPLITAEQVTYAMSEPDQSTVWTTANGFTLEHDGTTWNTIYLEGTVHQRYPTWESIPSVFFPMVSGTRRRQHVVKSEAGLTVKDRERTWKDANGLFWSYAQQWGYRKPTGELFLTDPTNFPWTETTQ